MPTLKSDLSGHWNSEVVTVPAGTEVTEVDKPGLDLPVLPDSEVKLKFNSNEISLLVWVNHRELLAALES